MPKQPMLSTAPARRSSTPGGGPDPVPLAAPNAGAFPMNTRSSRRRTGSLPTASRAGLRARTPTGPLALEPLESICSVFPWAPSSQEMEPPGNPVQLKHGGCGRRGWRKLHRGVDQSGVILVHTLTEATGDDATTALDLLNAVEGPLVRVTAEAAYDTVAVYETATARGATVIIPPAKTANISGHGPRSPARDRTVTLVKQLGRRRWKKVSGYHRQGRVENTFFRYKSLIGDGLRARSPAGQGSEAVLGRPVSYRIGT